MSQHDQALQCVIDALGNTAVNNRIRFRMPGFGNVGGVCYWMVRWHLRDGDITVRHRAALGHRAVYRYRPSNRFLVGFTSLDTLGDRAALVAHEAIHAYFDIIARPLRVELSEATAYIAQMLYFYHRNEERFRGGARPTFGGTHAGVQRAAWDVAMRARTKPELETADVQPLFAAIRADTVYGSRADDIDAYDGV